MRMKWVMGVVLTMAAGAAVMFAGCGNDKNSRKAAGPELRYGLTTEPATLDPLNPSNTADGRSILFNVFEGLVKPDTDGNLRPAAAESVAVEQGGLIYAFTLRDGLRFHDGSAVTAADAEFTLNTAIAAGFSGFTQIEKVETAGDRGLRVILKESDPEFLPNLTIGIVPKNNTDRERNPVGTGPFKIESYLPQQSLTLVKNPDYWQKGLPKLDRVTVVFVADSDALLLSLQGGNIDGATITGSLLQQLDQDKFDVVPGYSNSVQLLALNNRVKGLDDLRVRQAINYAIDIPEIIDTAFYGQGEPSGSPLIPALTGSYETALKNPYPVDIERARRLLAEAGYSNGFSLEITVPSVYTMHVDTAQVIVNQLAKVGVNAAIKLVDWATWLSDVYMGRKFEATIISLDANNVSPRSFLSRYRSDAESNFINFSNTAFDRVYDTILAEADDTKRAALYRETQRIISDNAASVYIQDIIGFKAFPKGRFGGVVNYPLYVIDFSGVYSNTADAK
ncbi:diguanylate phosphodiesterase [Spirochaetia bacterium]|nr:diguanylate phosphodiesterase [Spirochaetia bacterium]